MSPPGTAEAVTAWFSARIPDGWFRQAPAVEVDREEILVVGDLEAPGVDRPAEGRACAVAFREATRAQRMALADEAERTFGRKVSWGVTCDGERHLFTTLSTPVMTRLRLPERQVLDTLVDAGVARSRSDALAWCVRLVGRHQGEWIRELQEAVAEVARRRAAGPDV